MNFDEWTLQMNLRKQKLRGQKEFVAILEEMNAESLKRSTERGGPAAAVINSQREARIKMQA